MNIFIQRTRFDEGSAALKLFYPFAFCLGFLVGFMSAFDTCGVPPPPKRGDFQPINRRLADMVKHQH